MQAQQNQPPPQYQQQPQALPMGQGQLPGQMATLPPVPGLGLILYFS